MTICIAAIAKHNNEEVIVTATDQMITLTMNQAPIVQSFYEHTIEKYKIINKTTMALLAGNPLIFNDLIKLQATSNSFSQIRENIFTNFKIKRVDSIQKQLLNLYNTDWKFVIDALKTPNVSPPTLELLKIIANYKLGTEILLVGFEGDNAMISSINESGFYDYRDINFHSIGSGNVQASNTLLNQKHSKDDSLTTTIYTVYKAKRDAEVMAGVGKETDLLILTKNGQKKLTSNDLITLNSIYMGELNYGKTHSDLSKLDLKGI